MSGQGVEPTVTPSDEEIPHITLEPPSSPVSSSSPATIEITLSDTDSVESGPTPLSPKPKRVLEISSLLGYRTPSEAGTEDEYVTAPESLVSGSESEGNMSPTPGKKASKAEATEAKKENIQMVEIKKVGDKKAEEPQKPVEDAKKSGEKKSEDKKSDDKGAETKPTPKKKGEEKKDDGEIIVYDDEFLRKGESPPTDHPAHGKLIGPGGELVRMRTPPLEKEQGKPKEVSPNLSSPESMASPPGKARGRRDSEKFKTESKAEPKAEPSSSFAAEFEAKKREIAREGPKRSYGKLNLPAKVVEKPRTMKMTVMGDFDQDEQDPKKLPPRPKLVKGQDPRVVRNLPFGVKDRGEFSHMTMDNMMSKESQKEMEDKLRTYVPGKLLNENPGQYSAFPRLKEPGEDYKEKYMSGKALGGLREGHVAPIEKATMRRRGRVASLEVGAVNNPQIKSDGSRQQKAKVSNPTSPVDPKDPEGFMKTLDEREKARDLTQVQGRELAGELFPVLKKPESKSSKDAKDPEISKTPPEPGALASLGSAIYSTLFAGKGKPTEPGSSTNTITSSPPRGFGTDKIGTVQAYLEGQLPDVAGEHLDVMGAGGSISGNRRRPSDSFFNSPEFIFFHCRQRPRILERHPGCSHDGIKEICCQLWEDITDADRQRWEKFMKMSLGQGLDYDSDYDSDIFDPSATPSEETLDRLNEIARLRVAAAEEWKDTFVNQPKRGGPDMTILKPEQRYGNLELGSLIGLPSDDFVVAFLRQAGVENAEKWYAASKHYDEVLDKVMEEKKAKAGSDGPAAAKSVKFAASLTETPLAESSKTAAASRQFVTRAAETAKSHAAASQIPRAETSGSKSGITNLFKSGAGDHSKNRPRSGSSGPENKK